MTKALYLAERNDTVSAGAQVSQKAGESLAGIGIDRGAQVDVPLGNTDAVIPASTDASRPRALPAQGDE